LKVKHQFKVNEFTDASEEDNSKLLIKQAVEIVLNTNSTWSSHVSEYKTSALTKN